MLLRNRDYLHETRALREIAVSVLRDLVPSVDAIGAEVVPGCRLEEFTSSGAQWITIGASPHWGVAVHSRTLAPPDAPLARAKVALALMRALTPYVPSSTLTDEPPCVRGYGAPASGWSSIIIPVGNELSVWAAVLPPCITSRVSCRDIGARTVRVRLFAEVSQAPEQGDGGELLLGRRLRVRLPELTIVGVLSVNEEVMLMVNEEADRELDSVEHGTVPVTIDLGSIELTLADVAALRKGVALEMATNSPVMCFLRIGTSEIARGAMQIGGEGISIKIDRSWE